MLCGRVPNQEVIWLRGYCTLNQSMICPLCDCPDWESVSKNKDGVSLRVQCSNCRFIYQTRFRAESVDYRLADAYSHGRTLQKLFTAYGMEMESGELVLSTDPKLLLEWFAS
jgi:hypothetical protein